MLFRDNCSPVRSCGRQHLLLAKPHEPKSPDDHYLLAGQSPTNGRHSIRLSSLKPDAQAPPAAWLMRHGSLHLRVAKYNNMRLVNEYRSVNMSVTKPDQTKPNQTKPNPKCTSNAIYLPAYLRHGRNGQEQVERIDALAWLAFI
jgi:hypothetical protein